jgi:hypothetical protein
MRKHIGCERGYTWLHDCGYMGIAIIKQSFEASHTLPTLRNEGSKCVC